MNVYDADGNLLADIPISEKQMELLNAGGAVKVQYHTPQLLRGLIADRTGSFILQKTDDKIVTDRPAETSKYLGLHTEVAEIRAQQAGVKDG